VVQAGPGSSIKNIYYSGINDAFMVELRCASCVSGDVILADRVIARYVRGTVLAICDRAAEANSLRRTTTPDLCEIETFVEGQR
jgi:hypothetical protein